MRPYFGEENKTRALGERSNHLPKKEEKERTARTYLQEKRRNTLDSTYQKRGGYGTRYYWDQAKSTQFPHPFSGGKREIHTKGNRGSKGFGPRNNKTNHPNTTAEKGGGRVDLRKWSPEESQRRKGDRRDEDPAPE